MSLAVRRALLALAALVVAQAVWIITVPPFRGADEIDHVYRAAGVATGQVHLPEGAAHGRGVLVWVPSDLVQAAQAQCTALTYLGHDNCYPVATSGDRSLIATSAGGYDPLFYTLVGNAAKPFHGAAADYVMRATAGLVTALLLALAVGLMTFAGAGRWATLGILAALTPEVIYSGALPSPNGVEMGLGFVLWAALLAAVRRDHDPVLQRRLLAVGAAAAVPLSFLRMLGPLWVLLIVGAVIATIGRRAAWQLIRRQRRVVSVAAVAVFLGVCWMLTWLTIASHVSNVKPDVDTQKWILAFNLPAFVLQMVGAFPFRDQPAPIGVYPLAFFVVGLMLWAAWRRSTDARTGRAVLGIAVVSLLVPVLLSVVFMPSAGAIWQGRYELPFVIGILPLCGLLLDDAGFAPVESVRLVPLSGIFLVVVQVVCVWHVQAMEKARPQSVGDPSWWHPPGMVVAALMLVACGLAAQLFRASTPVVGDVPVLPESVPAGT